MIRHQKLVGVFVACTMLGFLALTATPTTAHVPPDNNVNFNPDEFSGAALTGNDEKEAEIPSDHQDGFGTEYEFRAVADSATGFYEWYDCDDGANPTVAGPTCALVATDTIGDAAPAPAGEGPALSFSAQYNIPSPNDGTARDIFGFACSTGDTGGPPANTGHCIPNDVVTTAQDGACNAAVTPPTGGLACVANAHADDAQTVTGDHAATTNGRIHMIVTASGTFTHPAVHGAGLKNGEAATFIAFTSGGGTVDAVQICLDQFSDDETANDQEPDGDGGAGGCNATGTDITPTSGGGPACHASAPTAAGGDCFAVTITPTANTVYGASLIEIDDLLLTGGGNGEGGTFGTGDCAGSTATGGTAGDDCQLDKIYLTTTAAGEAVAPPPPPGVGPPPPAGARCNRIRGTRGNDKLRGTRGCDIIKGRGGNDKMRGRAGDDRLRGGGGFDVAKGGPGRDRCTAEVKRSC